MSLITCCPACGTKFRVVADQLRISEGWVRCGRCQEVFDATQALEEASAVTTPAVTAAHSALAATTVDGVAIGAHHAQPEPEPAPAPAPQGYELPAPPDAWDEAWLDAPQPLATGSITQRWQQATERQEPVIEAADAPEVADALAAEQAQALVWAEAIAPTAALQNAQVNQALAAQAGIASVAVGNAMDEPSESDEGLQDIPSFVKQAQRKAWWNQPAVRFVMGMLVIFLPLALLLQIAVQERNTLVAWQPQWRAVFEPMCVALRCELAPRKSIASVALTGSSFHEDGLPHHYRLGLSIQNQAATAVATPALELTLMDGQEQVLVRKVFMPEQIGAPLELAARSEWNGTLSVQTQGLHLQVAGYRVMAFYP